MAEQASIIAVFAAISLFAVVVIGGALGVIGGGGAMRRLGCLAVVAGAVAGRVAGAVADFIADSLCVA